MGFLWIDSVQMQRVRRTIACGLFAALVIVVAACRSSSESAEVASAVCDTVATMWQSVANVQVTRAESTFSEPSASSPVSACHVSMVAPAGIPIDVWRAARYWPDSLSSGKVARGWREIIRWAGDGPDGYSRTLIRRGVRCHVEYEYDGGDDSDSTYVPSPREAERTSCWSDPAGVTPRDTLQ